MQPRHPFSAGRKPCLPPATNLGPHAQSLFVAHRVGHLVGPASEARVEAGAHGKRSTAKICTNTPPLDWFRRREGEAVISASSVFGRL